MLDKIMDAILEVKQAIAKEADITTLPDSIDSSWHIDDVKSIAEDLTDDECRQVLQLVDRNHDATVGINWDVLENWADYVRDQRETAVDKFVNNVDLPQS